MEGAARSCGPWKVTYEDGKRMQAVDLVMKALDDVDKDWDFYIAVSSGTRPVGGRRSLR